MCGRYSLRVDRDEIRQLNGYDLAVEEWEDEAEFIPRYNIAPRSQAPVIRHPNSASDSGRDAYALIMQTMKWGLVPHWSKSEDKSLNTINARAENLIEGSGMWAGIKGTNRCAVPCQGYYEWLAKGKDKLPHFTKRKDGRLLLMTGLYDAVVLDGKTLWTFAIVTTEASADLAWLHARQPVFLPTHDAVLRWLAPSAHAWTPALTAMVQPSRSAPAPLQLECYAVPKEVGKVGTESPSFIEPLAARRDGIKAMFSKQERLSSPAKSPTTSHKRKSSPAAPPSPPASPSKKPQQPAKTDADERPSPRHKRAKREDSTGDDVDRKSEPSSPKKPPTTRNIKRKSGSTPSPSKGTRRRPKAEAGAETQAQASGSSNAKGTLDSFFRKGP